MVSVNFFALGIKSTTVLASKKALVSEVASNFGSKQLGAISSNYNSVAETSMSYKGIGKFTCFNIILSGLKLRGQSIEKMVKMSG